MAGGVGAEQRGQEGRSAYIHIISWTGFRSKEGREEGKKRRQDIWKLGNETLWKNCGAKTSEKSTESTGILVD